MKHKVLRSVVHDLAASLTSAYSFLTDNVNIDVIEEAGKSPDGRLTVDFLKGSIIEGGATVSLRQAVDRLQLEFVKRCRLLGANLSDVKEARVAFLRTGHFLVSVTDAAGRRSTTEYSAWSGQRTKVIDELGRLRPKPPSFG